jgi:hypothetical protein
MSVLSTFRSRVRALFRRSAVERDMDEELRFHLEMQEQAFRDSGLATGEARDAALRQFGGLDQVRETAREQRGWLWLDRVGVSVRSRPARLACRSADGPPHGVIRGTLTVRRSGGRP